MVKYDTAAANTLMKYLSSLTMSALLGCGLMAGLFFAFSVCVMKALGQLPPPRGMAAMQSINVAILNPVFLAIFCGTALACAATLVITLLHRQAPGAGYLLAASACYLLGVLLVTGVFNVPLNDALARAEPESAAGVRLWGTYLTTWTMWNHVRTVAAVGATALFALALKK